MTEIFDANVLIKLLRPIEENSNVRRANIGLLVHVNVHVNVCSKVQTENANLTLAKSRFKTAFIN